LYLSKSGSLPNAFDVHGIDPTTCFFTYGDFSSSANVFSVPAPGVPETNLSPK
jgi:hypothetical protein